MKKVKSVVAGKGKIVLYQKDKQFTLMFEYKEDKNNLLFVSSSGEVLKDILNAVSITDQREDAVQFCFKLNDTTYKYCEYEYAERSLIEDTIDYNNLTINEIREAVSGYYDSLEQVYEIYGKDSEQIIVECYFENSIY